MAGRWRRSGIVRLECSADLPVAEVIRLADLTARLLPPLASSPHKDPRAPQNLVPIGGLERELRHRLGDQQLLYRSLRAAAATWPAHHIAAHRVTLGEVREAILERPYWAVPGREGALTMTKQPEQFPRPEAELERLAEYYDSHDTGAEMEPGRWVEPQPMATTSLRLPVEVIEELKRQAQARHVRYTSYVRSILERAARGGGPPEIADITERLERIERAVTEAGPR